MSYKILCVSATTEEAAVVSRIAVKSPTAGCFITGGHEISLLVTGVGSVSTAWSMKQWLCLNPVPDIAVNIGIAGSYRDEIRTGEVVLPVSDCFADLGIEANEGFVTASEAGLIHPDEFPFSGGILKAENRFVEKAATIIRPVNAITVNTVSGTSRTIEKMKRKFNPDIETMEGATFFYICARENMPFIAIRAISNRIEIRDRKNWNISLALDNLAESLGNFLLSLD